MKILAASLGAVVLVAPGVSLAQVTQSYSYDANGRLTGVVTSGGAGTHTSAYAYDAANNRTSRSQSGATARAAIPQLPVNQFLQPDEALVPLTAATASRCDPQASWSSGLATRWPQPTPEPSSRRSA